MQTFQNTYVLHLIAKILQNLFTCVPLTNRVWGPYRKLWTDFFPLRFMAQGLTLRAINRVEGGGLESVTYSTDREDEVSKIFITSL